MKSSRLLEMLLTLQTHGTVTAAELASRLEVSPRTIYRDAEALGAAGVPIYTERGRGGGIRLLSGFRTDLTGLTEDEARALFVLTTGGAHADLGLAAPLRSAVAKVLRAVPAPFQPTATAASDRILVDPVGWLRSADGVGELGTLQSAVFADRRLRIGYQSSGQRQPSERIVDPYGLVCKSGVWYLVADSAGAGRLFRVSRVHAADICAEPVIRRDGVSLGSLWEQLRRQVDERPTPVLVRVLVRRTVLDLFCRLCAANLAGPAGHADLGGGSPVSCPAGDQVGGDEWVEVPLGFPAVKAARPLLSFGDDVVVLSPAEVRDELVAVASAVVARYAAGAVTR